MPIVPDNREKMSLAVPGLNVQAPTATAQALTRLGGAVADVGFDLAEQVHKAEAVDTASSMFLKDSFETEDYITQLKQKYPSGIVTDETGTPVKRPDNKGYRTITDEYREWSAERYRKNQEALGSELAQQIYREKAGPLFYRGLSTTYNSELTQKTQTFIIGQDRNLKLGLNRQVETPNPTTAYALQNELLLQLEAQRATLRLSPEEYESRVQMIQKSVPNSVLEGYESLAIAKPGPGMPPRSAYIEQALALLHGNDRASRLRKDSGGQKFEETMSPEDKARWIQRFETLKQQVDKMDASDWLRRAHSMADQAASPEGLSNYQFNSLTAEGQALHKNGQLTDTQYLDAVSKVSTLKNAYPVLESAEFKLASPEKKAQMAEALVEQSYQDMLSRVAPSSREKLRQSGIDARQWIRDQVARKTEQVERLAQDDFVQFAQIDRSIKTKTAQLNFTAPRMLEDPQRAAAYRERNQQIDNLAAERGQENSSYLSKIEVEGFAAMLTNSRTGYTEISRALKNLQAADPSKYTAVMEQVISQGKNMSPAWYMALMINRPDLAPLTDEIVEAIVHKGQYPNSEAMLKQHSTSAEEVKSWIESKGSPYFANLIMKSGSPLTKLEKDAVVDTLFNMTMKKVQGGTSPNTAVEETMKQFLGAKFHLDGEVGGGFFSGGKKILIPAYINGQPITETDKSNLIRNLTVLQDNLADINPDVPAQLPTELVPKWSEFLRNKDNIRFPYNDRKNVYNIKWKDTTLGQWHFLMKDGSVIEIPVDQLIIHRPENQTVTQKAVKKAKSKVSEASQKASEAAKKKNIGIDGGVGAAIEYGKEFLKGLF